MEFEYTACIDGIDYGFFKGGGSVVLIKTGLGGNCMGYENKYLHMAAYLQERYHCSVIVASNPNDGREHTEADRQAIERFAVQNGDPFSNLFFFGHSNGGVKGLALANSGVHFEKMILVNMPLMINPHKTKRYLTAIPQAKVLAVYGEHDPSFPYVPFIDGRYDNLELLRIPEADHNFLGLADEFLHLSDWLFVS